jgi:hypothetical protein
MKTSAESGLGVDQKSLQHIDYKGVGGESGIRNHRST